MEARLADDAALGSELQALQRLRDAVRDGADHHAAPAALRARVQALSGRSTGPVSAAHRARQRWARPAAAAALAFAVVLASALGWVWQQGRDEPLEGEVIASHVRATLGQHLVDVASSDRHTVKPWLSARLDFSPPVPEFGSLGTLFLGGRLDYLDGRPVAALVYRQSQHIVDAFVWPANASDSRLRVRSQRGFNIVHWSRAGMAHWVVSDLSEGELVAFAQALDLAESSR